MKVHYLTKTVEMSSAYTLVYCLSTYNPSSVITALTLQQAQDDVLSEFTVKILELQRELDRLSSVPNAQT